MFKQKMMVLVTAVAAAVVLGCAFPTMAAYRTIGDADGVMLGSGDWHWFGVTLVRGQAYRVTLTVPFGEDFDIAVYYDSDRDGYADSNERLALGNEGTGRNESIYFRAPVSGRFHIKVWSYHGSGFYTVKVAKSC